MPNNIEVQNSGMPGTDGLHVANPTDNPIMPPVVAKPTTVSIPALVAGVVLLGGGIYAIRKDQKPIGIASIVLALLLLVPVVISVVKSLKKEKTDTPQK